MTRAGDEAAAQAAPPDLAAWRDRERRRLRAARRAVDAPQRELLDRGIASGLERLDAIRRAGCIAVYWPLPGEPDLRPWYERLAERGVALALPVVVERDSPVEFRRWLHGRALSRDTLNIPAPVDAALARPDIIVAPCLGFDAAGYRLGNGGGYYDRTLAAIESRPPVVGVGYNRAALPTIHPQDYDVPMDAIVTEDTVIDRAHRAGP